MTDWLKANPSFSMDDYLWGISVPFARIMAMDATYTKYLSEKQAKKYGQRERIYTDPDDLMNDLGIPVFG